MGKRSQPCISFCALVVVRDLVLLFSVVDLQRIDIAIGRCRDDIFAGYEIFT
jgi:hypothetical protein